MDPKRSAAEMDEGCGSDGSAELKGFIRAEFAKFRHEILDAVAEVRDVARATTHICHVRGVNPKSSAKLLATGIRLEGDEGARIIREERMLAVSDFLKQNAGKYIKLSICWFSRRLKARKLEKCEKDCTRPYLQHHMGEYRIAYMEADRALMQELLTEMTAGQVVPDVAAS